MKSLHHLFFIVIVALAFHNAHAASSNPPETPKEAVDAAEAANNKRRVGYRKQFVILRKRGNKKVEQESPQAVIEVNVASNDYCSSRTHPETKDIKMGSDSGELVFSPRTATVCSGDSVRWTIHHGFYDYIRFDPDANPSGVNYELLGERGDAFTMRITIPGTYEYYSEPFRGAGMAGVIVVL